MMPFAFVLAWREGRSSLRRVGLYGLSISLGVAAMVSVHSFRDDVTRSIQDQARELMGADARFEAQSALPEAVEAMVDSIAARQPVRRAGLISTGSMVLAPGSGQVRLLQLRGVEGGWPLYGAVTTAPADAWGRLAERGVAIVDAAVRVQLAVEVGDTLSVGGTRVEIVAVVEDLPSGLGFQTALGPRVWLGRGTLDATGLIGFGSLVRHELFIAVDDPESLEALDERYDGLWSASNIDFDTAQEQADQLTRGVRFLGDFLGLVGLAALLLGGVGVASAIHVFVKERLAQVAVLRCLGARQHTVFLAYLIQAAGLGLVGAGVGAGVGVVVQQLLPGLVTGVLPVDVEPRIWWGTVATGVGVGVGVSSLFALLPLLGVLDVPPLRALRHTLEASSSRSGRRARILAGLALALVIFTLAALEAPSPRDGIAFAASLAAVTALLWATGVGVIRFARRTFPEGAPYPVRQGYSNLFRPANQTIAVTLALGLGGFIVATLLQIQGNLDRELALEFEQGQPDALLFDIQSDQVDGVVGLLPGGQAREVTPIVQARLAAVAGVSVGDLQERPAGERPPGWTLRREYRHTWRAELTEAERLVEGAWWGEAEPAPEGVARVSVEQELAADLGVGVGDEIVWSIAGRDVRSRVSSLREVDWERFQTNFFVVFEPGSLEGAPATFVALAEAGSPEALASLQRTLIERYPNVSVLDIGRVRDALEGILGRVDQAIGFLAVFSALAGLVVLAGALAASRHHRLREAALLRTLGSRQRQVLGVFLVEYLSLGLIAAVSALALSALASWALVAGVFEFGYRPAPWRLLAVLLGITGLTVVTGWLGSAGLLRRPPLQVLRELTD
jgi:putative ABC transport system permease protein